MQTWKLTWKLRNTSIMLVARARPTLTSRLLYFIRVWWVSWEKKPLKVADPGWRDRDVFEQWIKVGGKRFLVFFLQIHVTFIPARSYAVEGLKPDTLYMFSLAARSEMGLGVFTKPIEARTAQSSECSALSSSSISTNLEENERKKSSCRSGTTVDFLSVSSPASVINYPVFLSEGIPLPVDKGRREARIHFCYRYFIWG